jgi:heme-degrading monooxygenase HmoA
MRGMYATFRRIKVNPGQAAAVAKLIDAEYIPLVSGIDGFVSYTLVDVGDDEVASIGTFTTSESADAANAAAQAWTKERLAPLVASPLEARAGAVLVDSRA